MDTDMQLSRFQTLQAKVFGDVLPQLVGQALGAADLTIQCMKQRAFSDMYCDDTKQTFVKLSKGIQGCLTDQIYRHISKPLELPHFVLEEAAEVHAQRAQLHHQLYTLQIAQQKISNIHEAVRTETTLQKDLLGSPVSSPTVSQQLYNNNTDSMTEEWFDTSSASSADSGQLVTSHDAEVPQVRIR